MRFCSLYLVVLVMGWSGVLLAQNGGGEGNGYAQSELKGNNLAGELITLNVIFSGGQGNGYYLGLATSTLSQPVVFYNGGSSDGYTQTSVSTSLGGNLIGVFSGGQSDGYGRFQSSSFLTGGLVNLFSGGNNNGYTVGRSEESTLETELTFLFEGGLGDGYNLARSGSNSLVADLGAIFSGGEANGYTLSTQPLVLAGEVMEALFMGGQGNGYSFQTESGIVLQVLSNEWIGTHEPFDILLYPNPNAGKRLNIELLGDTPMGKQIMRIYNTEGKLLLQRNWENSKQILTLDWTWPAGGYLITFSNGDSILSKRLIVN